MADFNLLWVVTGCLLLIQGSFSQQIPVLIILMAKIDLNLFDMGGGGHDGSPKCF